MQFLKTLMISMVVLFIGACSSSDEGSSDPVARLGAECSDNNLKQWAYENLQDYYLFYDQVPVVNPLSYESAESLVESLRVLPFDRFSRIVTTSEDQEVFGEGKTFGIGAIWIPDNQDKLRVGAVHRDSPLGRAGIARGDELLALNGVTLDNLTGELYQQFVGTRDQPRTADWTFVDAVTGQQSSVAVAPALYNINTVLHTETITPPDYSEKVGYLVLDSFLGTTESELDEAIDTFREDGIKELVLDLRYNGGGLVTVAMKLASQIAGPSTHGNLMMEYRHNNKYTEFDFSLQFEPVEDYLDLDRLVVLTTEYTASASELVISALSPYIEVVTIGDRTTGKPYITLGNDYCGKSLHALQAEGFNADDVSVYGGVAPSCGASDDVTRGFGVAAAGPSVEGLLDSALDYLVHGTCDTPTLASGPALQNDSPQSNSFISEFSQSRVVGGSRIDGIE